MPRTASLSFAISSITARSCASDGEGVAGSGCAATELRSA
jgi:hypothetical protein